MVRKQNFYDLKSDKIKQMVARSIKHPFINNSVQKQEKCDVEVHFSDSVYSDFMTQSYFYKHYSLMFIEVASSIFQKHSCISWGK